jgi:hypothetical protein
MQQNQNADVNGAPVAREGPAFALEFSAREDF